MRSALLSRMPAVSHQDFSQWAAQCDGIGNCHFEALRLCRPILRRGPQRMLDIGPDPLPWLRTIQQFAGPKHELWAARQGNNSNGHGNIASDHDIRCMDVELDLWSPIMRAEAANALPPRQFSLITALHVVESVYHPAHFFQAVADAMAPGGVLVLTARNVSASAQILELMAGKGLSANIDDLIDSRKPAPRFRQYCWRELHRVARSVGMVLLAHGFFGDGPDGAASADQIRLQSAAKPLLLERRQLEPHLYMVLEKSAGMRRALATARHRLSALRAHVRRLAIGASRTI